MGNLGQCEPVGEGEKMTMNKKHKRNVDYHEELIKELKNHDEAVAYLNLALEESLMGGSRSSRRPW